VGQLMAGGPHEPGNELGDAFEVENDRRAHKRHSKEVHPEQDKGIEVEQHGDSTVVLT
jgi:hypothetical protein